MKLETYPFEECKLCHPGKLPVELRCTGCFKKKGVL